MSKYLTGASLSVGLVRCVYGIDRIGRVYAKGYSLHYFLFALLYMIPHLKKRLYYKRKEFARLWSRKNLLLRGANSCSCPTFYGTTFLYIVVLFSEGSKNDFDRVLHCSRVYAFLS